MEKYQIFAVSSILLILANNWHIIDNAQFIPHLFDYTAYGFFVFGIFKLIKKQQKKS